MLSILGFLRPQSPALNKYCNFLEMNILRTFQRLAATKKFHGEKKFWKCRETLYR